jgi:four helix bundle protein
MHDRTMDFAAAVAVFTEPVPKTRAAEVFGRQLIRSGSSVGANYRSAGRAQSVAHMISKLSIAEEEADESIYWLQLLARVGAADAAAAAPLIREASELVAIIVASKKKLRARTSSAPRRNSQFAIRNSDTEGSSP